MTPPGYVYRILDEDKNVIYIGSSTNIDRRVSEHKRRAAWWPAAKWIETERFSAIAEARAAEIKAIQTENPSHNRKHRPAEPRWVTWAVPELEQEWRRLNLRRGALLGQLDRLNSELAQIEMALDKADEQAAERAS